MTSGERMSLKYNIEYIYRFIRASEWNVPYSDYLDREKKQSLSAANPNRKSMLICEEVADASLRYTDCLDPQ